MVRDLLPTQDRSLLYTMASQGWLSSRGMIELQNLYTLGAYKSFVVDSGEEADFVVYTPSYSIENVEALSRIGTAVVVLLPNSSSERETLCDELVERNNSATIMRREYLLLLNNHLPKQHLIL